MSLLSITTSTAVLNGSFTKIAMLLCVGLLACIVFIWRNQGNRANSYFVYTISIICIFVALNLRMISGTLADEINLGGTIFPELSVIVLGVITIFFTLWRSGYEKK